MRRESTKYRSLVFIPSVLLGIFIIGVLAYTHDQESNTSDDEYLASAEEAVTLFITQLQGVLINELLEGGPLRALSVCADTAQELTETIGSELGVDIKRVSQRVRNTLNAPDEIELAVLERFQRLRERGEEPPYVYSKVREINDTKEFLYFQSIHIQPACIACHGKEEHISSEIRKFIEERYPEDQAVGYSPGDLRGAVRLKLEIKE